jgi:hypothetical protein
VSRLLELGDKPHRRQQPLSKQRDVKHATAAGGLLLGEQVDEERANP